MAPCKTIKEDYVESTEEDYVESIEEDYVEEIRDFLKPRVQFQTPLEVLKVGFS